ncbi:hypothetical protein KAV79_04695 [Candidatus Aerophobetes bacterium]|nr:hypothetical protein [Candidatus Aerophobetes bacterium]
MARKIGFMDKEVAESEKRQKEHLSWLKGKQAESREIHKTHQAAMDELAAETKGKQAESREIHKTHQAAMDELAAETRDRSKKFIASNRGYAKTLGKFDDNR